MTDRTPADRAREEQAQDAVDLLIAQHERIKDEFAAVRTAEGAARREAFGALRELLAVHETAEELVVRPATRRAAGGDAIADARIEEEKAAKRLLADLEDLDPADPIFVSGLDRLRAMVLEHAEHEERDEFPLLRMSHDADERRRMADLIRRAEAVAPTHPHPHVNSATANTVLGPMASIVDRVRDAVRGKGGQAEHGQRAGSPPTEQGERGTTSRSTDDAEGRRSGML